MEDVFHKDESKYIYNVSLDYDVANPFKKLLFIGTGTTIGGIAYGIALRLAIGAATEFAFMGAVAIAGLSTVIGVLTIIPGIIGLGIYELYRIYKNKNVKELYEGLKNVNNRRYEIERELYYKTLKEFESFIHNLSRSGYNQSYKQNVIAKTKEIIQIINPNNKQLSEDDFQ